MAIQILFLILLLLIYKSIKNQEKIYITKMYIAIQTFSLFIEINKIVQPFIKDVYFKYPRQGFTLRNKFLINNPFIINLF